MDYTCERGAKRNFEPWRAQSGKVETEEERLDRLEAEEAEQGGVMEQLEAKVVDAKREMDIADALDEIRTRNARIQRAEGKDEVDSAAQLALEKQRIENEEQRKLEEADAVEARAAFARRNDSSVAIDGTDIIVDEAALSDPTASGNTSQRTYSEDAQPLFRKIVRKKKGAGGFPGIKRKPSLV